MREFAAIIGRDLRIAMRQGSATVLVVVFFVITVTLFPLGVGPELNILARIAPGVTSRTAASSSWRWSARRWRSRCWPRSRHTG